MLATVVETKELWQTALAALVAGVGVTIIFSLAIYGATRFADLSRDDRRLAATSAALLAILALVATLAAVVIGIVEMTRK
jgi:cytochrome c biogenesis protein CcdA